MTVTPDVAVHADGAAPAAEVATAPGATTAMIAIAAPAAAVQHRRVNPFTAWLPSRPPDQHGASDTMVDAVDVAIGRVLPAIAGTACTVANTLAAWLGGKKNDP